jgi:hypothetical protein
MNPKYEAPCCGEWIEILPTTDKDNMICPWCRKRLRLEIDAEFIDGHWHDLSKLVKTDYWDKPL